MPEMSETVRKTSENPCCFVQEILTKVGSRNQRRGRFDTLPRKHRGKSRTKSQGQPRNSNSRTWTKSEAVPRSEVAYSCPSGRTLAMRFRLKNPVENALV